MTRCFSRNDKAIAYSAGTVFPAEVWADTKIDWTKKTLMTPVALWRSRRSTDLIVFYTQNGLLLKSVQLKRVGSRGISGVGLEAQELLERQGSA
jgi:hypothetical protein